LLDQSVHCGYWIYLRGIFHVAMVTFCEVRHVEQTKRIQVVSQEILELLLSVIRDLGLGWNEENSKKVEENKERNFQMRTVELQIRTPLD
jgi:hypothetical protein